MLDKVIDAILSKKAHGTLFVFWLGPGVVLSVLFRHSFLWVAIMSAYANLMLHLLQWHQARKRERDERRDEEINN
jgi:hypothetical protein